MTPRPMVSALSSARRRDPAIDDPLRGALDFFAAAFGTTPIAPPAPRRPRPTSLRLGVGVSLKAEGARS